MTWTIPVTEEALVALLRSTDPILCFDLYEITLTDGTVLRYTTADVPLNYDSHPYGTGILFERSQIERKAGLEVDTLTVTAYATAADLIQGIPFHDFIRRRGFHGAYLVLRRAYLPYLEYWTSPEIPTAGAWWKFEGWITRPTTGGLKATIPVKSPLACLDEPMPRALYQAPCRHVLFDAGCGVNPDDFDVPGMVQSGSTVAEIGTDLIQAAGWFDLGTIKFTSGALNGIEVTIKSHTANGNLTGIPPLIAAPAPGDTFTAWPGCDLTLATCKAKFAQESHYGGQPFIPPAESAR